jgi:hypothetical protein
MAKPTPEEIEAARAMVAEADAEAAREQQAVLVARFAPLRDFIASAAFAEVKTTVRSLAPTYRDDESIYVHLRPIADFMDRLDAAVLAAGVPEA